MSWLLRAQPWPSATPTTPAPMIAIFMTLVPEFGNAAQDATLAAFKGPA
jgi:hypothetical protein